MLLIGVVTYKILYNFKNLFKDFSIKIKQKVINYGLKPFILLMDIVFSVLFPRYLYLILYLIYNMLIYCISYWLLGSCFRVEVSFYKITKI